MASFESPLGNKKFSGQQLKEFDVPDETNQIPNEQVRHFHSQENEYDHSQTIALEKEMAAAREARNGREKITSGAKRRIEILLGMIKTTRDVEINGTAFVFQSLKTKEMRAAIIAAAEYDNTVQSPFEIRKQFLARSIIGVAGQEMEYFLGSNSLDSKLAFIEELDEALLNRLYDEYLILAKEAHDKFAVKTQQDINEVIDDLKK